MESIVLKIAPELLSNPDLDIRYVLPDIINKQSEGLVQDDGYDYTPEKQALMLFFKTEKIDEALSCIVEIVEQLPVLDNDLRKAVIVAVEKPDCYQVVYPPNYQGDFSV